MVNYNLNFNSHSEYSIYQMVGGIKVYVKELRLRKKNKKTKSEKM